jgi:hypothetical protein
MIREAVPSSTTRRLLPVAFLLAACATGSGELGQEVRGRGTSYESFFFWPTTTR